MKAFIFPGQGSQYSGMAKKLYDNYSDAKDLYDKAKKIVGKELVEIGFDADEDTLKLTQYSQISIFLYSYILFVSLVNNGKISLKDDDIYLGHSLGEITALAASKSLNFEDAVKFVRTRGEAMGEIKIENGIMAALLKPNIEKIDEILKIEYKDKLFTANLNSYSQIVLSGLKEDFDNFNSKYQRSLFLKSIPLKVSAPFHTVFMMPAKERVQKELKNYDFNIDNAGFVISNKYAKPYEKSHEKIKETISDSIISQVNWIGSILYIKSIGYNEFIEIGPKSILIPFVKDINTEAIAQCFID